MKNKYDVPAIDIILFEAFEIISSSGDYEGVNFEALI